MRKYISYLIIPVVVTLVIALGILVYTKNSGQTTQDNTTNMLYSYQNTYVGDNSSIGGILYRLPFGNNISSFMLGTKEKPYTITINYDDSVAENELLTSNLEYISTALFALVHNVDYVVFNLAEAETVSVSRDEIQDKYSRALSYYAEDVNRWQDEIIAQIYK